MADSEDELKLKELSYAVYDAIRLVKDPEKDSTLEDLNVLQEDKIKIEHFGCEKYLIDVEFMPTVPHCSLATLIGLCIRIKLERSLLFKYKLFIHVAPGTHDASDEGICSTRNASTAVLEKQLKSNETEVFKDVPLPLNLKSNIERSTSLVYLLKFIRSAKKDLDLCLLIFTLNELQEAIIEAKRRGIVIRVIIDKTMSDCDGSCMPALQRENIPVMRGPTNMMVHHKFVVADSSTEEECGMVATGSINWTWGAVTSNYENMIITNNPEIVLPFKNEFERLWAAFSR